MAHQFEIRAFNAAGEVVDITVSPDMASFESGCQLLIFRLQRGEAEELGITSVEFWRMDTDPPRKLNRGELEEVAPAFEKLGGALAWEPTE